MITVLLKVMYSWQPCYKESQAILFYSFFLTGSLTSAAQEILPNPQADGSAQISKISPSHEDPGWCLHLPYEDLPQEGALLRPSR